MPEILEIETYRRLAERAVGRQIESVTLPDAWWVKGVSRPAVRAALADRCFVSTDRIGKLLLLETSAAGPTLGLRFGMTGRLVVDGVAGVDQLEYAPRRSDRAWDRVTIRFRDGGDLRVVDPRRLGALELEPDTTRLGPDAAAITAAELGAVLAGSRAPLKARLMDQGRVAGLGNLLTDEILWRAGLDPARPAGDLTTAERRRLHRHLRRTLEELAERGGSHTGDLQVARQRGGQCPRDGEPLERRQIGGRTTYSCPRHQV